MATTQVTHDLFYAGTSGDGFLSTDTNPPQIERLYGRRFRGVGADHGAQADGSVTGGSWLQSFPNPLGGNVVEWDYFEDQSWDASVANSKIARSSVSRTFGGEIGIGVVGAALNDGSAGKNAWGAYFDGVRSNASAGVTHGVEVQAANLTGPLTPPTPFQNTANYVGTLHMGAGSDPAIFGNSYAIGQFIGFGSNGARAHQGILVRHNAIKRDDQADTPGSADTDGYGRFASLPNNIGLSWWSNLPSGAPGTQQEVVKFVADVQGHEVKWWTGWLDDAFVIRDDVAPTSDHFRVKYAASCVAGIQISPAAAGAHPSVEAVGDADDVNLLLRPKGSGVVMVPITYVREYADDTAAAAGGVIVGGTYRTGSVMKIRVS